MSLIIFFTCRRLFVFRKPPTNSKSFIGSQETGGVRPIEYHPPTETSYKHGCEAFDDENPCPTRSASNSIHLCDRSRKQTTKRACQSGSGEECCCTNTELGSLVPTREIVLLEQLAKYSRYTLPCHRFHSSLKTQHRL